MKKLDLENKVLKIGKTSFNTCNLAGMTREEFMDTYKGILDAKAAWKQVSKYAKVKTKAKDSSE